MALLLSITSNLLILNGLHCRGDGTGAAGSIEFPRNAAWEFCTTVGQYVS